jgi:aminoglycoside phosphotransferase (APT) family kinase protein
MDLPATSLEWVASVLRGPVVSTMPIGSATTADVVVVRTASASAVLKRYADESITTESPDGAAHEAALLEELAAAPVAAPRLLAVDPDGTLAGVPSVLMTQLSGAVETSVPNPDALAGALVALHGVDVAVPHRYQRYTRADQLVRPTWMDAALWDEAAAAATPSDPTTDEALIHRDLHPANLLWDDGELTGIVDWFAACIGPRALDVAHLRVNLALAGDDLPATAVAAAYARSLDPPADAAHWELVDAIDLLPSDRGQRAVDAWPGEQPWWSGGDSAIRTRFAEYLSRALDEIG